MELNMVVMCCIYITVFEHPFTITCGEVEIINIALRKPASQSSTYSYGRNNVGPERAVDGIVKNVFSALSCSHTDVNDGEPIAWWEVDLLGQHTIGNVRILNRANYAERLHDLTIYVCDTDAELRNRKQCVTQTGTAPPGWLNLSCEPSVTGRYVRITKPKTNEKDVLTLCEVEIYEEQGAKKPAKSLLKGILSTIPALQKLEDTGLSYLNCCSICG